MLFGIPLIGYTVFDMLLIGHAIWRHAIDRAPQKMPACLTPASEMPFAAGCTGPGCDSWEHFSMCPGWIYRFACAIDWICRSLDVLPLGRAVGKAVASCISAAACRCLGILSSNPYVLNWHF